jgi:hypothetical protein
MSARPVVKTTFMDATMQEASIMAAQVSIFGRYVVHPTPAADTC